MNKENDYVCKAYKINFYISEYFFGSGMARELGDVIETFGMLYMEIFENEKSIPQDYRLNIPVAIRLSFSESGKSSKSFKGMKEDEEFRVFSVYKDDIAFKKAVHIESAAASVDFLRFLLNGKLPNSIKYEKLPDSLKENAKFNGLNLGVPSVIIEMILGEMCRNSDDPSEPFRMKAGKTGNQEGYESARIKDIPSLSSTWAGLGFEDINTAILSGLIMSKNGKKQNISPTEALLYV